MAKKLISDLSAFDLYIFDLDNTIYNEEDYLLQAYAAICDRFGNKADSPDKEDLLKILLDIYRKEGTGKLFDKFLKKAGIDQIFIVECLEILRTFHPPEKISMFRKTEDILNILIKNKMKIFVLTNGNPVQQRNKIRYISWKGKDKNITFIFANEIEAKPSPAGIRHIQQMTGNSNDQTVFIGDSETDQACARNAGIAFFNIRDL